MYLEQQESLPEGVKHLTGLGALDGMGWDPGPKFSEIIHYSRYSVELNKFYSSVPSPAMKYSSYSRLVCESEWSLCDIYKD